MEDRQDAPLRVSGYTAAHALSLLRGRLQSESLDDADEEDRIAIRNLLEECRDFMRVVGPLLAHQSIRMTPSPLGSESLKRSRGNQRLAVDPSMIEKAKLQLTADAVQSLVPDTSGISVPKMLSSVSDSDGFQSFSEPSYEGFPQRHNVKILKQKKPQFTFDSKYGVRGKGKASVGKMQYIAPRQPLQTKNKPQKVHLKTPYPFYSGSPVVQEDILFNSQAAQKMREKEQASDPLTRAKALLGGSKSIERTDRGLYGLHQNGDGGEMSKREELERKKKAQKENAKKQAELNKRRLLQKKLDDSRTEAREAREAQEAEEQRQIEEQERNERRINRMKQERVDLNRKKEDDEDFLAFLRGT
jgi:hypothetical protein